MLSIVIPTYEMRGAGTAMLRNLLDSIKKQITKHEYEVIVSDNSANSDIRNLCFSHPAQPEYHYNPITGASENINNAISLARYDMIKIMCQDDYFNLPSAVNKVVDTLKTSYWLVSGSVALNEARNRKMLRMPRYNPNKLDMNITGMPSVIAFRACPARFDTSLKTFCDLDFYRQLYNLYGMPALIKAPIVVQRYHSLSQSQNQPATHKADSQILTTRYNDKATHKMPRLRNKPAKAIPQPGAPAAEQQPVPEQGRPAPGLSPCGNLMPGVPLVSADGSC